MILSCLRKSYDPTCVSSCINHFERAKLSFSVSQLEFLKLESVKQCFSALTVHYELVTVKCICLKHPCTHTLTVACYSLLIDCFDLLDTGAVFLNLLMNVVMTWSCGMFVCVWRTIALYISTSFSTSPSFQRYYIPYRASMRERERKERRKRKEKWTRLALICEVFAEVDVVGVLCSPQPNKRLRNCLFMQIIQNNKLLAGKASTTVTSPCN